MLSGGIDAGGHRLCALPLPRHSSLVSYRKQLIRTSGASLFAAALRRHLQITWLWWSAGLYIFVYFNSFCLKLWLPMNLNLDAD